MRRTRMTASKRRRRMSLVNVALLGVGLIFLLAGVRLATTLASEARTTTERVERLVPLSATAINDSPAGREVLIEGRISDRNPALVEGLVAYGREEYRGGNSWEDDEQRTPPLWIEVPDGTVVLADSPYRLDEPPHRAAVTFSPIVPPAAA